MATLSTPGEWLDFLRRFATVAGAEAWPGNPPASEAELLKAETRLKIKSQRRRYTEIWIQICEKKRPVIEESPFS